VSLVTFGLTGSIAMRPYRFLVALFFLAACSPATAQPRPTGSNCNLTKPPESSGEEVNHGATLRIFPRAKDIGPGYSGCQTLWAPDGNRWVLVSLVEISRGDPTRVWSPDEADAEITACRFKDGEVVRGDPAKCPVPRYLILKSLAPGCVERIRKAIAKGEDDARGCKYE
jgi:hypothetical protein